ncbi:MAG: tRNA (adenosine(37)-N6)-threonylcarbamoyltransferase complex ATPase subunit type 1 TsaE [Sedimenticola sp.]|nr:tRNA (adenosine(37)-N6)-threonylcarbamoyltransferase complex ATPase subunit type 1 TsaE [Sedimenticola sp.]MCW8921681.1 tRNA (adenosine(37)-N6)-threonylcarbamoyltransferase complex ATPase subunit type 1 TsaE [Sedimenticola sp.]MCW8947038.1 tRNA (adenosine(37)-N6)-threonylcarbamoyltransferase complex ATPase subunit type 1 TsaE [Sedimenticola sp.]MCW8949524.1 tRNA (adenosine(37)-N6)-threonylcarbamoyltransferase complex ATPase subunit type 1 TsaE [Sedimenticola sp.]
MMVLYPQTELAQEQIGSALARACTGAGLIFLKGDLGAGKTTLARGFLRGMGYTGAVKSPTYTLIEPYEINDKNYYHLDLYRLADPDELEFLGLRDLLNEQAVLLVEWPEQGGDALPLPDLLITIIYKEGGRELSIDAQTSGGERMLESLKDELGR